MKYNKRNTKLLILILVICIIASFSCIIITKAIHSNKSKNNYDLKEQILLKSKEYLIVHNLDYVNLETLYNQGYIKKEIDATCDKKLSYVSYYNSKYFLYLNCDRYLETLTLSN